MSISFLTALVVSAATPPGLVHFDCAFALQIPQGQLTAPASVTINFVTDGTSLTDVHVIDRGGILYPGGNFRLVNKPNSVALEAVALPPERPGVWTGMVEKKLYRLVLNSGRFSTAVQIDLGRKLDKRTGRFGVVWSAINQFEGSAKPLSGAGIGSCASLTEVRK